MKKRREAFFVKQDDPMFSLVMSIMPRRYDATNYAMVDIPCEGMDSFIRNQIATTGRRYSYMHIVIAALVKGFAMRPHLNRFIMNARLYEHYGVTVSFTIKQTMVDNAEELIVKHTFCGHETIVEISDILDKIIENSLAANFNATKEKTVAVGGLPVPLSKMIVGVMKFLDKHNRMPKSFLDISPFHTSFFITNLKSIKMESVNHHCYDFGTTSLFFAMGKEKLKPVVNEDKEIVVGKIMQLGISSDERICDGHYMAKSFHLLRLLIAHPEMLMEEYHDAKTDAEIERRRLAAEKEQKKLQKKEKKNKKSA